MAAKRSGPVMVLAVDVVGDGPTKRHVSGARRGRQEPTPGHDEPQDFVEADAALGAEHALLGVEGDESVKPAQGNCAAAGIEAAVPIGAVEAYPQDRASFGPGFEQDLEFVGVAGASDELRGPDDTPPGFDRLEDVVYGHRIVARAKAIASGTASPQLKRSLIANATGSSSNSPRPAISQIRAAQIVSTKGTAHSQ